MFCSLIHALMRQFYYLAFPLNSQFTEFIFFGAPDKVERVDNGQQVTAWGFTQSEKMCVLTCHHKLLDLAEAKSVRIIENIQKRP